MLDGRLWHFMHLCIVMGEPTGLPGHATELAQNLYQAICQTAGVSDSEMLSVMALSPTAADSSALRRQAVAVPESKSMYRVVGNPLVDAFLGAQEATSPIQELGAAAAAAPIHWEARAAATDWEL